MSGITAVLHGNGPEAGIVTAPAQVSFAGGAASATPKGRTVKSRPMSRETFLVENRAGLHQLEIP
jgi:hypothetical protein